MTPEVEALLVSGDVEGLEEYFLANGSTEWRLRGENITLLHVACLQAHAPAVRWLCRSGKHDVNAVKVESIFGRQNRTWPIAALLCDDFSEQHKLCAMELLDAGSHLDPDRARDWVIANREKNGLDFMVAYKAHLEDVRRKCAILWAMSTSPLLPIRDLRRWIARHVWALRRWRV